MAGYLSGPGVGLPFPQSLYPANVIGGDLVPSGNEVVLAPAQQLPISRGRFFIDLGPYAVLQFMDPVSTCWRTLASSRVSPVLVDSDGFNFRVANLTGCAVGAIVTTAGTTYVQGSTTITPSAGNSQWYPVIGGLVSTTVSITAAGAGYTIPPIVFIPPPPPPGVQANAIAVISSGTVSSITLIDQGAGYLTAPVPQIYPNPTDPALASGAITSNATAKTTLVGAGTLAAVLCLNPGSSFATVPSLTIAGAGTSAAATIIPMWTLASQSLTSGGVAINAANFLTTIGGTPAGSPANTNPTWELTGYVPRPAMTGAATVSGGTITTVGTIIDGGLFLGTPSAILLSETQTTAAVIALTMGSRNASVLIQPAG